MQFNASENDQITVPAGISDFYNASQGTISFWMRSSGTSGSGSDGAVLFDMRSNRGMLITQTDGGQIRVRCFYNGAAVTDFTTSVNVSDNQWHDVAVAFTQTSGGNVAIYIDGVQAGLATNSSSWGWTTSYPMEIGRCSQSGHTPSLSLKNYNGLLDDFRFYNARLTPTQIGSIAAGSDESITTLDAGIDVKSTMQNVNASAFIRVPFTIADVNDIDNLLLSVRYSDGFVAWINGVQVASVNEPVSLAWDSAATAVHSPNRTFNGLIDDLSVTDGDLGSILRVGTNILALQGLNDTVADGCFLILPQLSANVTSIYGTEGRYFATPTPGALNSSGTSDLGPVVSGVSEPAAQPGVADAILVTAHVAPTLNPIQNHSVTLHYRVMYGSEFSLEMYDDGSHGDGDSGDGLYGATIPAGVASPGQMLRWYVSAGDTLGHAGRWPILVPIIGNDGGPEYEGTVVARSLAHQHPADPPNVHRESFRRRQLERSDGHSRLGLLSRPILRQRFRPLPRRLYDERKQVQVQFRLRFRLCRR